MVAPEDYDDVIVTVAHPMADVETTLRHWIETGPGPRPFVTVVAARWRNGDPIPLEAVPLQFRNSRKADGCSGWGCCPRRGGRLRMRNHDVFPQGGGGGYVDALSGPSGVARSASDGLLVDPAQVLQGG